MDYPAYLKDDRFVIFLFHGVIDQQPHEVRNYTRKHLPLDYFADSLQSLLNAGGHPISLDAVKESHELGTALPPRSFVITFDDGFRNNLTLAAPVLDDLNVTATFYVTSDFIDSNRMSWIDRIEWAVEQSSTAHLSLPWGEEQFVGAESKKTLLTSVREHLKQDKSISTDEVATSIQSQLGLPETWTSDDLLDQKMTWKEVRELNSNPLFSVGGHSHSHAILSFLDETNLAHELDMSLRLLMENAGITSRHYSYPEGLEDCYSPAVVAALKARGVEICPNAIEGDNDLSTDLFHLRRVMAI